MRRRRGPRDGQGEGSGRGNGGARGRVYEGVINVLKPPGMTSHDVVDYLRRLAGQRRVGHTGTLDPPAAGVLLVCLGRATRIAGFLAEESKVYRAEITLGITTDTGDAAGRVLESVSAAGVTPEAVAAALASFEGDYLQVPPMVSAVRVGGRRLYELARAGRTVPRPPRRVRIHRIEALDGAEWGGPHPRVLVEVACAKGTYIRSLAADLGARLGCGAHVSFLLRTAVGRFTVAGSRTLEELAVLAARGRLERAVTPVDRALGHLPAVEVLPGAVAAVRHGRRLYPPGVGRMDPVAEGALVRLVGPEGLLAVARAEKTDAGRYGFRPVLVL
ncbi:MAG: tRNA pseudouridine(55) synthase TruB [Firmicutes bacterium]|nr:tRNA pseudouridine(55) synthase TruB [Bacillota bacterium]